MPRTARQREENRRRRKARGHAVLHNLRARAGQTRVALPHPARTGQRLPAPRPLPPAAPAQIRQCRRSRPRRPATHTGRARPACWRCRGRTCPPRAGSSPGSPPRSSSATWTWPGRDTYRHKHRHKGGPGSAQQYRPRVPSRPMSLRIAPTHHRRTPPLLTARRGGVGSRRWRRLWRLGGAPQLHASSPALPWAEPLPRAAALPPCPGSGGLPEFPESGPRAGGVANSGPQRYRANQCAFPVPTR